MSPSLSWIEDSGFSARFSDLTRPVGSDRGGATQPDLPQASPPNGGPPPAPHRSPPPPGLSMTTDRPLHRRANDGNPPPSAEPPGIRSGPIPVPANQDPWMLTPNQPWTAVVVPTEDHIGTEVPDLLYPPNMALAARLELFRDWIRQYCGEGAFFVADPEGLPLLLDRVRTSQAVTAVALERALHTLRGLLGSSRANSMCIELEDGRLVQTVWTTTNIGRIAVGMAPPRPLGPSATAQVRRALDGLFPDGDPV